MKFLLVLLNIIMFCSLSYSNAQELTDVNHNIEQVNQLFSSDPEVLIDDEVIALSQKIIKQRTFYNNDTLGKIFSLLADVAINKGDLSQAMQFSLDGVNLANLNKNIRLALMLKMTSGYYFTGQYQQAQKISEQSVNLAKELDEPKYLIKAFSYRAMINALNLNHQEAFADLQEVETLLANHPEFSDHITVISVLANAHFYMQDYQTAATLYQQILTLRYQLLKEGNIEQTYYGLAKSYFKLERLDDAYNAYWKAINLANEKSAPILTAYAQMGLGQVLIKQENVDEAIILLKEASHTFQMKNLHHPYLTALISLAKTSLHKQEHELAFNYFKEAELVANQVNLTYSQIELFRLLSEAYYAEGLNQEAYINHVKYLALYRKFSHFDKEKSDGFSHSHNSNKRRELSLGMADKAALQRQFAEKYSRQSYLINLLYAVIVILLIVVLFLFWRARATRLNQEYEELERPEDYIATPYQTKHFYQQQFKMARKHQYPLIVGYFSIDNWQELEFHFNKKIVNEVSRTVAKLVNEHTGEFDQVGLINQGEYLFLCPHQNNEYLQDIFIQLAEALKVQFFANLGEFTIKISYDYKSTNVQDIDPYVFLSRLSDSTKAKYTSYNA